MKNEMNYPIKYAVLELKQKGGWIDNYKEITQGFIASKCFVVESIIKYNPDGSSTLEHNVVFPFDNFLIFKEAISKGIHNLGIANTPSYDIYGNPQPVTIVDDLYLTFDEAKAAANEKNEKYKEQLAGTIVSVENLECQYELLKQDFEKKAKLCNLFEQIVLEKTNDMRITNEKEDSYVKVLNPFKK